MLQAMNTGHEGSMTTAHANSPRDVLYRIEVMTLMAGMELPLRAIREQVASAIDVLVQMARCPDGRRRVVQICTVDGLEGDTLVVQEIFRYRARRAGQGRGTVEGFEGCGFAPSFWADLSAADGGCPDDAALFGEGAELTLLSGGGGHGCA